MRVRCSASRARAARAALAGLATLALLGAAPAPRAWLELEAPAEAPDHSPLPLYEVRGRAGPRGAGGHDLVIALDVSDSTTRTSGVDLDGDGPQGRSSSERLERLARELGAHDPLLRRLEELDLEDSVLFAELAAAEALISRLDSRRFRIGLVTFSDEAWLAAPLQSPRERLRFALERTRRSFFRDLRGTDLAAAVRRAQQLLARSGTAARERSILLLSDGTPTLPVHGNRASEQALVAARAAAADGIRIYSFQLGQQDEASLDVYRAMAAESGGRSERLASPADAIARLRRVDLADLDALRIENLTTRRSARVLRVFPDGSFDGFVELAPGPNRLRVDARASDGRELALERTVVYDAAGAEAPAARQRAQELVEELRRRTRELELWAEVERGRRAPRSERELDVEPQRRDTGG